MLSLGIIVIQLWLNFINSASSFNILNLPTPVEFFEKPVDLSNRIVKGEMTSIEDHPYQVSFTVNNMYFCGGFIISSNYILTAAHCSQIVNPDTLVLRAGSSWRKNGTIIPIAEVIPHPEYNKSAFDKDVAVLKTAAPIVFSNTIKPIALPPKGREMKGNSIVTVTGWGKTEQNATSIPERLRYVTIPVVPYWQCHLEYFTVLTRNMWCGGDFIMGGKGTCQGDSGGAATQDDMAVGIVSFGRGCGQLLSPSVFADIASPPIRDFITEHTKL